MSKMLSSTSYCDLAQLFPAVAAAGGRGWLDQKATLQALARALSQGA